MTDDGLTPGLATARAGVGSVVAREYRHRECGGLTRIEGYAFLVLANPFSCVTPTWCRECRRFAPLDELEWADTGEDLASYRDRLLVAAPFGRRCLLAFSGVLAGALAGLVVGLPLGLLAWDASWWPWARDFVNVFFVMTGGIVGGERAFTLFRPWRARWLFHLLGVIAGCSVGWLTWMNLYWAPAGVAAPVALAFCGGWMGASFTAPLMKLAWGSDYRGER